MLRDLRQAAATDAYEYDLCIVGAGAAGIVLAMEFAGTRTRVCLLESGGLDFDPDTQDLYRGEVIGLQYADLDVSRLRYFGGTTNHWAGYCAPFADYAFERQPWTRTRDGRSARPTCQYTISARTTGWAWRQRAGTERLGHGDSAARPRGPGLSPGCL